jgi:hypothetical protein
MSPLPAGPRAPFAAAPVWGEIGRRGESLMGMFPCWILYIYIYIYIIIYMYDYVYIYNYIYIYNYNQLYIYIYMCYGGPGLYVSS